MDKKAIKTFAIESRKKLIEEVKYQASLLGITAKGIAEPVEKAEGIEVYDIGASNPNTIYDEAIKQRKNLVKRINEKGFDNVVEEVAYTWFNRIIAIRFMEVNDYLPTRVRVLSSETEGKIEPDIVTEAPHLDLDFTEEEIEQIYQLKNDNKLDELFRLLFIKQCNKLNEILPELFEKTADYTELLLSISFTNEDGVIRQLVDNISEEDFNEQVEIIGWFYQYYNTEINNSLYEGDLKRKKVPKELLPAATQMFTPEWPVRYMVQNSVGRYWIENNNTELNKKWDFYLDIEDYPLNPSSDNTNSNKSDPQQINIFDPCMGSGHILVSAFEILMDIYTSVGYNKRDSAKYIIENNLYGIDIDDRAHQLSYFAILMKARYYNKHILQSHPNLNLCSIHESNNISLKTIDFIFEKIPSIRKEIKYLIEVFRDAKEYGSILKIENIDFTKVSNALLELINLKSGKLSELLATNDICQILALLKQAKILSKKYNIVITNPPYLNHKRMDKKLLSYVKTNFPDTKTDFAIIFYQKSIEDYCQDHGYVSFITPSSWMFLTNFEKFRKNIIKNVDFVSLVDFGTELFDGKIGHNAVVSWVTKKSSPSDYLTAIRLTEYCYSKRDQKETEFFNNKNRHNPKQLDFLTIPTAPIAYWVSKNVFELFKNRKISDFAEAKAGIVTGNDAHFIKAWYEINFLNISFNIESFDSKNIPSWVLMNKGGHYRKFYGNNNFVLNLKDLYDENKTSKSVRRGDPECYFKESLTWSMVTAKGSFRYSKNKVSGVAAPSLFIFNQKFTKYILGFLNTNVSEFLTKILNPTVNLLTTDILNLPLIISEEKISNVNKLVDENIAFLKEDWDNDETSYDFKSHGFFVNFDQKPNLSIKNIFGKKRLHQENKILLYKSNLQKLNNIFIDLYGMNNVLTDTQSENHIELKNMNISSEIKSFISYSVGCMFGRYNLDENGLIYAGGIYDPSKYTKFIPDNDNIIPVLDSEYFEDDIVGRFVEFVKVSFGEENLENNLDFISLRLKNKGSTSREVIRNYFLTDFYKNHVKSYKKRPIYWLFDSGKNNGFKALIYMHRYEPDLVARIRTDYLHKTQKALETAIAHNDRIIETSTSASEKSKAVKAKNKLVKQLEETRKYDEALAHVANQKIEIDLDDGVKVNYAKFQGVEVSSEGQKAKKIDLLKKI